MFFRPTTGASTIGPVPTEIVAHRGASKRRPEHTLAAYELAVSQGADGLECDVRLTRDGHLVCVHDRTLSRTSSGSGVVSTRTLAALDELDFGDGPGVLTLEDLLGLVVDAGRPVRLFVETKHPVRYAGLVEAALLAQLTRHGLARPAEPESAPVVMMSFSTMAIRRIRARAPRLPTVQLWGRVPARYADGGLPAWADIAGPSLRHLRADPEYVDRAAERGNDVYCWTVDEPIDVEHCQRIGVRYLATNTPAEARAALTTAAAPTPRS